MVGREPRLPQVRAEEVEHLDAPAHVNRVQGPHRRPGREVGPAAVARGSPPARKCPPEPPPDVVEVPADDDRRALREPGEGVVGEKARQLPGALEPRQPEVQVEDVDRAGRPPCSPGTLRTAYRALRCLRPG